MQAEGAAAAAAGGGGSGGVAEELSVVNTAITKVEVEIGKVEGELEQVKKALADRGGEAVYLHLQGQELKEYLKALMKKEEQLRREKEQLREEKAKLMGGQETLTAQRAQAQAQAGERVCMYAICSRWGSQPALASLTL
jgi:chromosome segregation ATPase